MEHVRKSSFGGGFHRFVAFVASACLVSGGAVGAIALTASSASADTQGPITFESGYTNGSVNGQDGWTSTGSYDQAIVDNSSYPGAPTSFGTKSLRISDAVTSGSFGDQTFSKSTVNAAGETTADAGGFPTGTLKSDFSAAFDFASVTPGAEQSGLHMSVSPDRGDGARMSYVRIEDSPAGFNLFFDDYIDAPPLGSGGNLDDGCGVEDNFTDTQIATGISRTAHTLRFNMKFVPGPHNDVVQVLLDGNVIATGTSWEDYYRYCAESGGGTIAGGPNGGVLPDKSRITRNVLFREGGTADPANAGNGFLLDGVTVASNDACTTTCYVNDATGNDFNSGQSGSPLKTIQAGVNAVSSGGTVQVAAGTYRENVTVPKNIRVTGAGVTTIVEPAVSDPNCGGGGGGSLCAGASNVFLVQSDGVTIDHLKVDGDNPTLTSGVSVGGADVDARNGIITNHAVGLYNNLSVHDVTVKNVFLRGIYASSGGSFNIANNTVDNVNGQVAGSIGIFDFGGGGTISGNHVSNTDDGISANHSNGTTFTGNVVTSSASGVHTDNAGDAGGSPDVISGNTVSSCTAGGYGIWTFVPYLTPTISGNTVSGCNTGLAAFASCDLAGTNNCPGLVIPTTVFSTNTVTSVTGGYGLFVSTDSFGFGDGEVHASADHNVISGPGTSLYVQETGTATATLAANRNSVLKLNNTGATNVNATCNWWGQTGGPVAGQVTGSATTSPFLRVSNLAAPCPATVPGTPTPAFAVPYNDHGAKVIWRAPNNGGAPILGYRVIPYAAGVAQAAHIFNSAATTQLITGLTDGASYRFTVAARNVVGYGSPSAQSPAMIAGAPGQPGAPTVVRPVSGSLKNTFAAPMNNGAPITSYSVTCASSNGGVTQTKTGPASPITVTGLTPGKSYVCRVSATNSRGTGPLSNPSTALNA